MNFFSNVTPWYIYKSINGNLLAINIQYGIQADKTSTISKVLIITEYFQNHVSVHILPLFVAGIIHDKH